MAPKNKSDISSKKKATSKASSGKNTPTTAPGKSSGKVAKGGQKKKAKRVQSDDEDGDNEEEEGEEASARKAKVPPIPWLKEPHLTTRLLTYIEAHETTRTALGFSKGEGTGKHDGRAQSDHHKRIAIDVLVNDESGTWKDCDPKDLVTAIKNRLQAMKREVGKWDATIARTGAGITEDDAKYNNLIEARDAKYPYYLRMKALLYQSPTYDKSFVVNSKSSSRVELLSGPSGDEFEELPGTQTEDGKGDGEGNGDSQSESDVEKEFEEEEGLEKELVLEDDDIAPRAKSLKRKRNGKKAGGKDDSEKDTSSDESDDKEVSAKAQPQRKKVATPRGRNGYMLDAVSGMMTTMIENRHKSQIKLEKERQRASLHEKVMIKKLEIKENQDARKHEAEMLRLKIQLAEVEKGSSSRSTLPPPVTTSAPGHFDPNNLDDTVIRTSSA